MTSSSGAVDIGRHFEKGKKNPSPASAAAAGLRCWAAAARGRRLGPPPSAPVRPAAGRPAWQVSARAGGAGRGAGRGRGAGLTRRCVRRSRRRRLPGGRQRLAVVLLAGQGGRGRGRGGR